MARNNRDALRTLRKAIVQRAVSVSLSLAVLAGALVGGGLYLGNRAYVEAFAPTSCPAGCITNGTLVVSSDPVMQHWEKKIADANATAAGDYRSVVLLDPFTYSTGGTISQSRMEDELKGAYLALEDFNNSVAKNHNGVPVQLLLANEGTSAEEGEPAAVQQIENMKGPDHIVAVAGMGLSTANTETAATALSQISMPMFGAVTTGDELNGFDYRGFFQVVPDVAAQVHTLVTQLDLTARQPIALISSDQTKSDIYSTNLDTDFMGALGYQSSPALGDQPSLGAYSYDPDTAEQQFGGFATSICINQKTKHAGAAPATSLTVLYAGREQTTLPVLVGEFQQAIACDGLTVTIVTGSDANALPASVTEDAGSPAAKVIVVYSDIESVASLGKDGTLSGEFATGAVQPGSCPNQEYDPWEVATYDSVFAAAFTVPKADTVSSSYPAPAGPFSFGRNGELQSPVIPVYTEKDGACSSQARSSEPDGVDGTVPVLR